MKSTGDMQKVDRDKVFQLVADGYAMKEISCELGVSLQTVVRVIQSKKQTLGCKSLTHLIAVMVRKNML